MEARQAAGRGPPRCKRLAYWAQKPDYAGAHYNLALALRTAGQKDGAAREFREASQLDPELKPPPN